MEPQQGSRKTHGSGVLNTDMFEHHHLVSLKLWWSRTLLTKIRVTGTWISLTVS